MEITVVFQLFWKTTGKLCLNPKMPPVLTDGSLLGFGNHNNDNYFLANSRPGWYNIIDNRIGGRSFGEISAFQEGSA